MWWIKKKSACGMHRSQYILYTQDPQNYYICNIKLKKKACEWTKVKSKKKYIRKKWHQYNCNIKKDMVS